MKHIKLFENFFYKGFGKPKVGDYILCKLNPNQIKAPKALFNFINTTLGKVVDIEEQEIGIYDSDTNTVRYDCRLYIVQWQNIPEKLKKEFVDKLYWKNCLPIQECEYIEFGKSPEEIEMKMTANKYNL